MWATVVTLGSVAVNSVISFFSKKTVKTATMISVLIGLLAIVPFEIKLPDDIVEVFSTDGGFYDILCQLNYFAPVAYLCSCVVLVFMIKYTKVFFDLMKRIIEWFVNY